MTADDVKRILVVGAGQMGAQIAMQSALHGYQLTLNDLSMDLLQKAMESSPFTLLAKPCPPQRFIETVRRMCRAQETQFLKQNTKTASRRQNGIRETIPPLNTQNTQNIPNSIV